MASEPEQEFAPTFRQWLAMVVGMVLWAGVFICAVRGYLSFPQLLVMATLCWEIFRTRVLARRWGKEASDA